jgi:hypothetical protein
MAIVGINGISTNGEHNIDVLLTFLRGRGFETVDVALPIRHAISAYWGHLVDVDKIYRASKDGDIAIAHSFGGPRVAEAMKYRHFDKVFFIRPAMSKNYVFNRGGIHCFYSADDMPVRFGAWLPFHPFGKAGIEGFTDPSVTNIESSGDHNADFTTHLHQTVDYIVKACTT